MRNKDVLISGAGVAGQALAYWLRRLGFTPVVVERAPAPRDGGQAVDLRGAAIEVARRTGILDAARAARTGTRGMSYVSSAGKRLASLNGAFGVIGPEDVEIVRGDLVGILYEASPAREAIARRGRSSSSPPGRWTTTTVTAASSRNSSQPRSPGTAGRCPVCSRPCGRPGLLL